MATTGKGRNVRSVDLPSPVKGGGGILELAAAEATPSRPAIGTPPQSLTLIGTGLLRSAVTPTAYIDIRWRPPISVEPERYEIEYSQDSTFATGVTRVQSSRAELRIEVATGKTYHLRVRAIVATIYSPYTSGLAATTPADTVAPGPPTLQLARFANDGALEIYATPPSSDNYQAIEVKIYNSSAKTVQYDVDEYGRGVYRWSADRNRQQTSSQPTTPAPTVYIVLRAKSWGGQYSTEVAQTVTRPRPANLGAVTVDFTGRDAILSWAAIAGAVLYRVTITGNGGAKAYTTIAPRFVYEYQQNLADNTSADPTLAYSIVAVDALDQTSAAAASASFSNAAPASVAISGLAGFTTIGYTLTLPDPLPADFKHVRVRIYKDGSGTPSATYYTTASVVTFSATSSGSGSYTADATAFDVFGQASAVTTASALALDVLSLADLRSGAVYTDSIGNSSATLKAQLADGVQTSGGVSYALGTGYKWTQIARELTDRYEPLIITATAGQGYLALSNDQGATWSWFAGPLAADGRTLTAVASEAAAQAAPVTLPTTVAQLWDLPSVREAQYVRLYHRNTAAAYTIREWYAERVIEGDLIRAGTIRTLQLAAGAVVADTIAADAVTATKINVSQLSAIAADMGTITAGTVTGATIRTAASGQRVELTTANGLRGINSANVVQVQISAATGALTAAAGRVTLDAGGIAIAQQASGFDTSISWEASGVVRSYIASYSDNLFVTAQHGSLYLQANTSIGPGSSIELIETGDRIVATANSFELQPTGFSGTACHLKVTGGIVTGGATPLADCVVTRGSGNGVFFHDRDLTTPQWGWYAASNSARLWLGGLGDTFTMSNTGGAGIGHTPSSTIRLRLKAMGTDTATGSYGIAVQNGAGTVNNFWIRDDGAGFLRAGAWTFSDERAKEKIAPLDKGLASLAKIDAKRYDYIGGMKNQIGLLAQQVAEVLPELVMETPDGLALNYAGMVPVLINAIRELGQRLDDAERQLVAIRLPGTPRP